MKITITIEDCELLENKSDEMLKAYITHNLKMFKINKIEIITEVASEKCLG